MVWVVRGGRRGLGCLALSGLAIARLRLVVRRLRLCVGWLWLPGILVRLRRVRLLGWGRSLIVGALLVGASVFKLTHALANAPEQLGNPFGAEEQHQHKDDENDSLWIADKQEGENKHEQGSRVAVASGKTRRKGRNQYTIKPRYWTATKVSVKLALAGVEVFRRASQTPS